MAPEPLLLLLPAFLVLIALMLYGSSLEAAPAQSAPRAPRPPRVPRPGFRCPTCGAFRVVITGGLDLPPDMVDDEVNLQAIACRACAFVGVAVYSESCGGALDRETWNHTGHRMRQVDYDKLQAAFGRCPTPAKRDCACPTHRRLGRQERGQWVGLSRIPWVGSGFTMELERKR